MTNLNKTQTLEDLRHDAREIFDSGLRAVDARKAVRRLVALEGSTLKISSNRFDIADRKVYVVAIGKAAVAMAAGIAEILPNRIEAGLIAAPLGDDPPTLRDDFPSPRTWQLFSGGHPLPNMVSLNAGSEAFRLLKMANKNHALVIFLVSGGGSALIEWPRTDRITLEDLCEVNRLLVNCGARIAEINAVRRSFSAVKGGGLAAVAPDADQITLIISDTNPGDETVVASGPSLTPKSNTPSAREVVDRYGLQSELPESMAEIIETSTSGDLPVARGLREHYVLLDNLTALEASATKARELGYLVEIAEDVVEQTIDEGSRELVARLNKLRQKAGLNDRVCLLSGGEFACTVQGTGIGGRNLETALRCAMDIAAETDTCWKHVVVLSAGTDGIDGNSPAAGAFADENTIACAQAMGLDPQRFLNESDSFSFFQTLDSLVLTGPTGTNVRDVRIMLALGVR